MIEIILQKAYCSRSATCHFNKLYFHWKYKAVLKNAFNRLFSPNFIKNNQSVGYGNHKELKVKVEIIHVTYPSRCFRFSKYHCSLLDNLVRCNKLDHIGYSMLQMRYNGHFYSIKKINVDFICVQTFVADLLHWALKG